MVPSAERYADLEGSSADASNGRMEEARSAGSWIAARSKRTAQ